MIIPIINPLSTVDQNLGRAARYLPTIILTSTSTAAIRSDLSRAYWVPISTDSDDPITDIIKLLDEGAQKVILPVSILAANTSLFADIPASRLTAEIEANAFNEEQLKAVIPFVSALLIKDWDFHDEKTLAKLKEINKSPNDILPSGGARAIVLGIKTSSLENITVLQKQGFDISAPLEQLTITSEESKLDLGDALAASLVSDRADGLFPTIVVDEHDVALGLVYSSKESISESLKTGMGVYQSRTRGLWHKGATSGATQTLLRIRVDCDADALKYVVIQHGAGFCHFNTRTCFGYDQGLTALEQTLISRKKSSPTGSYTARLFNDAKLLRSKITEEAEELCEATTAEEIAWEAADLIYFALTKCISAGVSLADIERNLDKKAMKISRRSGDAKPKWDANTKANISITNGTAIQNGIAKSVASTVPTPNSEEFIKMKVYSSDVITTEQRSKLLLRPIINTTEITARVQPIIDDVRKRGDAAVLDFTEKFDGVKLTSTVIRAPFPPETYMLDEVTQKAIDQAYDNIYAFHDAQMDRDMLVVETMPGVICQRFARPIEKVGLYVPGGTAVLPSSTLMLGIPAKVAGCKEIVIATPPRKDGSISPEVMYVAQKVGATTVLAAGGAQAVAALAYGTESVPKVDKICGPGNQYVTAAKMIAQNDNSSLTSIDMPAGPSEVLVVADAKSNPAYVASDLLSQAEHGTDSQVVLIAVDLNDEQLEAIEQQIKDQTDRLPRAAIVRKTISQSFTLRVKTLTEAMEFVNDYAPEHLILQVENAENLVAEVKNAGSVFVGPYSPESCGDYASGTNHTLPTYGYAKMYSGVNTLTFVKHITSQQLTADGLNRLGDTVMRLAEVEGLEAHRNAVAIRLNDLRK